MLYRFDKQSLTYRDVTKNWILGTILLVVLASLLVGTIQILMVNKVKLMTAETKAIVIREADKANAFTPENLKAYILELNIRFPHIVYAQSRLETGNFKSDLFKHNNNLFGMRQAISRPTTNNGEENGFAIYEKSWRESVVDYALFQASYLNKIKTEEEYFQYLSANYDKDTNYVTRLKKVINEENSKLR